MKRFFLLFFGLFFLLSCQHKSLDYEHIILDKGLLNKDLLHTANTAERALLCTYLFTNGNECTANLNKIKCSILKELGIKDECSTEHLIFLQSWFKNDFLISHKLKNCSHLPNSIQNEITKIIISKNADTLSITMKVVGVNTAQEKNWEIEQKDSFIVNNYSFIRLVDDGSN
jgi:hypothetical protein